MIPPASSPQITNLPAILVPYRQKKKKEKRKVAMMATGS